MTDDCDSDVINHAAATFCIHVPTFEMIVTTQSARKTGWRSGLQAEADISGRLLPMNQLSSFAARVIFAFNKREIGQPAFAVCAAASNRARSAPGTFATTSRWISVTVQPASSRSIVKAAAVAIESGVRPPWPSSADSAIEKQPACAAAINSSGFVPRPFSKRVLNEYCVSARTPLWVERIPLPSFNPPRQTADAVRFMILRLIVTGVRRNEKNHASQRLSETFDARSHCPASPVSSWFRQLFRGCRRRYASWA